jgi:hypothetical protein
VISDEDIDHRDTDRFVCPDRSRGHHDRYMMSRHKQCSQWEKAYQERDYRIGYIMIAGSDIAFD